MSFRVGPRVRGTETGCALLLGIAFIIMGIWTLFYGTQYLTYALIFLGVGLAVALFAGILSWNQGRWSGKGKYKG